MAGGAVEAEIGPCFPSKPWLSDIVPTIFLLCKSGWLKSLRIRPKDHFCTCFGKKFLVFLEIQYIFYWLCESVFDFSIRKSFWDYFCFMSISCHTGSASPAEWHWRPSAQVLYGYPQRLFGAKLAHQWRGPGWRDLCHGQVHHGGSHRAPRAHPPSILDMSR